MKLDKSKLNESLLYALRKGNTQQVRRLIQRGADIDAGDEEDRPVLYWAVRRGDVSMVRLLLKHGPRLDFVTGAVDDTVLITAVRRRNLPAVKLLALRTLLNEPNAEGRTPVHVAVVERQPEILEYLLTKGAEPGFADHDHATPLALAARIGDDRSLDILLKRLPIDYWEVGGRDEKHHTFRVGGMTALHAAAEGGNFGVVWELLDRGAYVRACDDAGWSPLHYACYCNNADAARELIKAGALLWAPDGNGDAPLVVGAITCATDAMKVLIDALKDEFDIEKWGLSNSESVRLQNQFRDMVNEALCEAVRRDRLDVGRDPERPHSKTKFLHEFRKRQEPTVRMLLAEGANPSSPAPGGTAREIAARNGNEAALKVFDETAAER